MLRLEDITMKAGNFSLKNISVNIPKGKYAVLMGKSGSGKTTIIESVCGLRKVKSGKVFIDGVDVTNLRPAERHIGYVPQDGVLFTTMSIREQLIFGCRLRGYNKNDSKNRALEIAEELKINYLLRRKPSGLSGGEVQRVALARALASKPKFICMDEPLSSLDEDSRDEICELIKTIHQKEKLTILHVTHSKNEAELMGEIKLKLSDGQLLGA